MCQIPEETGGYGDLILVECAEGQGCESKNGRESRRVGLLQKKRNKGRGLKKGGRERRALG